MKLILTLAFILAAGLAHASGDPPKSKSAMAKSPPPVVQTAPRETKEACIERETAKCEKATWTKLGKRACIRWRTRACR